MEEVMMFMIGFSGVVSIFEIVKNSKNTKGREIKREAEKLKRHKKR